MWFSGYKIRWIGLQVYCMVVSDVSDLGEGEGTLLLKQGASKSFPRYGWVVHIEALAD